MRLIFIVVTQNLNKHHHISWRQNKYAVFDFVCLNRTKFNILYFWNGVARYVESGNGDKQKGTHNLHKPKIPVASKTWQWGATIKNETSNALKFEVLRSDCTQGEPQSKSDSNRKWIHHNIRQCAKPLHFTRRLLVYIFCKPFSTGTEQFVLWCGVVTLEPQWLSG